MKTISILLACACIIVMSCESGPTGADPGNEFSVSYEGPFGKTLQQPYAGQIIVSGVRVPITSSNYKSSVASGASVTFYSTDAPNPLNPSAILTFGKTLPTGPGTLEWKAAVINSGNPLTIEVENGPAILWDGVWYFSVSGTTQLTSFIPGAGNSITYAEGYANGILQDVNGNTITLQSFLFRAPFRK